MVRSQTLMAILHFLFLRMPVFRYHSSASLPKTLSVKGKTNFKIVLKEDSELLQEVVVTGYGGKVSRSKLTNSISTVNPQMLDKGIYTNPSQALSGSVPV